MWNGTVGLVNGQYKYLTAETFGHKVNANGVALKKKQLWTIEPFPVITSGVKQSNGNPPSRQSSIEEVDELENVAIKSHLNCYLAVDAFGNVTCDSAEKNENCRFTITICSMTQEGSNQDQISWAFRNIVRGYFLGVSGQDGQLVCNAKMPQSKAELWHVHLVPAPGATMFALRSIGRKRYARATDGERNGQSNGSSNGTSYHCNNAASQIQMDATAPWGWSTLFQFKYFDNGRYALVSIPPPLTSSGKNITSARYLTADGVLLDANDASNQSNNFNSLRESLTPNLDCLFTIEYHAGFIAFRDSSGKYLAASGRQAVLKTRSQAVGKDELFEFVPAPLQVAFRANFNQKWISTKQGVDLSANQNEVTGPHETFQMEFDSTTNLWYFNNHEGKYWSQGAASAMHVSDSSTKAGFKLEWNSNDGTCTLLMANGSEKPIGARKSGQLAAGLEPVGFFIKLLNRSCISLRSSVSSGFVGTKGQKLETGKTIADLFQIEYADTDGVTLCQNEDASICCCYLRATNNGKYLTVADGGQLLADGISTACSQAFQLELRNGSSMTIKTFDSNQYLNASPTGAIQLVACQPEKATLWEF